MLGVKGGRYPKNLKRWESIPGPQISFISFSINHSLVQLLKSKPKLLKGWNVKLCCCVRSFSFSSLASLELKISLKRNLPA